MKKNKSFVLNDFIVSVFILALSTLSGIIFRHFDFHETNIVIIYIFSVLLISRFTRGYLFGIVSSVVSFLLFNWFFTEPYYTLKVNDLTYIITFFIMTCTSILTSALTTKVKKSAEEAKERENESNALYQLTNLLTDAETSESIATIVVESIGKVLNCSVAFICFDGNEMPERNYIQRRENGEVIRRGLTDSDSLEKRIKNLHDEVDITSTNYNYPIYGKSLIFGVLRIPSIVGENLSEAQKRMLHSIIESSALALERLRSLNEQAIIREEALQERFRSNLLRAISHDIRTPLSGIMGISEVMMNLTDKNDNRYALAKDIYYDAEWLHGMVENILNLTKLEEGRLKLEKQPEALEEVIGAALTIIGKRFPERIIDLEIPEEVIMVSIDARLISQVIINLLDNADKYTPESAKITIAVLDKEGYVNISVSDNGRGISQSDLPHIFQMFYTTSEKSPDSRRGVGLGLAICKSIVEAHGGSIKAENRKEGGARFTFTLPKGEEHK